VVSGRRPQERRGGGAGVRRPADRRPEEPSDEERRVSADCEMVVRRLEVNGEARTVAFPVHHTLLEVLREELGLTGTKHGCELGECGTCTVLIDGVPVLSCLLLAAECEGQAIETVEGLAAGAELHPLQRAFADLG